MTFAEILTRVIEGTPGALAGAIMASDGIAVAERVREGAQFDLSSVAVEFQRVFDQSRKVAGALYGERPSALRELVLVTSDHQLVFRTIDSEYFVVIAVEPTGSLGKARYLVRSVLHELREAL